MSLLVINQFLTTNWLLTTLVSCDTYIQYLHDNLHFLINTPSFASIALQQKSTHSNIFIIRPFTHSFLKNDQSAIGDIDILRYRIDSN